MKAVKAAQLKRALRQRGLGKYRTKAIKRLPMWEIEQYLYVLSIEPGDIINDCDGYNHEVIKVATLECWPSYFGGAPVLDSQFLREDGRWSCGCPTSPEPPWPNARIRRFQKIFFLDEEQVAQARAARAAGVWTERSEHIRQALLAGEPITDERGLPLFPLEQV